MAICFNVVYYKSVETENIQKTSESKSLRQHILSNINKFCILVINDMKDSWRRLIKQV